MLDVGVPNIKNKFYVILFYHESDYAVVNFEYNYNKSETIVTIKSILLIAKGR